MAEAFVAKVSEMHGAETQETLTETQDPNPNGDESKVEPSISPNESPKKDDGPQAEAADDKPPQEESEVKQEPHLSSSSVTSVIVRRISQIACAKVKSGCALLAKQLLLPWAEPWKVDFGPRGSGPCLLKSRRSSGSRQPERLRKVWSPCTTPSWKLWPRSIQLRVRRVAISPWAGTRRKGMMPKRFVPRPQLRIVRRIQFWGKFFVFLWEYTDDARTKALSEERVASGSVEHGVATAASSASAKPPADKKLTPAQQAKFETKLEKSNGKLCSAATKVLATLQPCMIQYREIMAEAENKHEAGWNAAKDMWKELNEAHSYANDTIAKYNRNSKQVLLNSSHLDDKSVKVKVKNFQAMVKQMRPNKHKATS